MESASLGVIHQEYTTRRKERAKIEPRKLPNRAQGNTAKTGKGNEGVTKKRNRKGNPKQDRKTTQHMGVQAESPCLTLRWKILMLNQELV